MANTNKLLLGMLAHLEVVTHGQPGKRTFNLTVRSSAGSAVLWMEKEQLALLAMGIKDALEKHARGADEESQPGGAPAAEQDADAPHAEFKCLEVPLYFDPENSTFHLEAVSMEKGAGGTDISSEEPQEVECQFSCGMARAVLRDAAEIIAAGRPICVLCYKPVPRGEAHFCPRSNGHKPPEGDAA